MDGSLDKLPSAISFEHLILASVNSFLSAFSLSGLPAVIEIIEPANSAILISKSLGQCWILTHFPVVSLASVIKFRLH